MPKRSLENAGKADNVKAIQNFIYNTLAKPIHTIFGNPGNTGGYGGGVYGGAGIGGRYVPEYTYKEIYPADTIIAPIQETFNDAFARARRNGLNTFEFNGKTYTTELGDNPNWENAGNKRKRTIGLQPLYIPADTIIHKSNTKHSDIYHTKRFP